MFSVRYGLAAVLALIGLAACGGGGGGGGGLGGGGGTSGGGGSAINGGLSSVAGGAAAIGHPLNSSAAFGRGPASGLTESKPNTGVNGFKREFDLSALGLQGYVNAPVEISISENTNTLYFDYKNNYNAAGGTKSNTPNNFTVFSNGLVGSTYDTLRPPLNLTLEDSAAHNAYVGVFWEREFIMLGGGAVPGGLDYTNFGFWEDRGTFTGTHNGTPVAFTLNAYSPFVLVSNAATNATPTAASGPFKGAVVANAYDRSNVDTAKVASLVGTATLNLSSAASGQMTFSFPNFYTLASNLYISGGAISQSGGFTVTDAGKDTTGIKLSGGGTGTLSGQFYGSSATNASEAAGIFGYSENGGNVGVKGSWGVNNK